MVSLSYKVLVIHAPLDDQQTCRYERLLKELALEHFDEVLDSNVWFLLAGRGLRRCLPVRCLLLLQGKHLLLLLDAHLVALFQGELRILAVDALRIYG